MKIRLSDHFTCRRLLRFTLPSIVMMIFTSIYGVVDGLFVSNFVGKTPFAAINLIMPFLMAFGALGFMIGTGGSALVAKTLGEGKRERANALFSMLIVVTLLMGALVAAAGMPLLRPRHGRWARRGRCWRTVCATAAFCCPPRGHSCCKTCSRASLSPPSGRGWD